MLASHWHEHVGDVCHFELGPVAGDYEKELDVCVCIEVGWSMLLYGPGWRGQVGGELEGKKLVVVFCLSLLWCEYLPRVASAYIADSASPHRRR